MTQHFDLQAQMEGESEKAYLGYVSFRDMGAGRTIDGAYLIYRDKINQKGPKPSENVRIASPSFKEWSKKFNWADRVRDWDNKKLQRIQSEQLEADRQGYIDRIEQARALLEEIAFMGMHSAKLALAIGYSDLQKIAKIRAKGKGLIKADTEIWLTLVKGNSEAMSQVDKARIQISDAMGLVQTIEQLNAINRE